MLTKLAIVNKKLMMHEMLIFNRCLIGWVSIFKFSIVDFNSVELLVWISVRLIYIIELVKLVKFCLILIRLIN